MPLSRVSLNEPHFLSKSVGPPHSITSPLIKIKQYPLREGSTVKIPDATYSSVHRKENHDFRILIFATIDCMKK